MRPTIDSVHLFYCTRFALYINRPSPSHVILWSSNTGQVYPTPSCLPFLFLCMNKHLPDSLRIVWATKSACLSVLKTPVVRKVGVMSVGGSFTWDPKIYTTLAGGERARINKWNVCFPLATDCYNWKHGAEGGASALTYWCCGTCEGWVEPGTRATPSVEILYLWRHIRNCRSGNHPELNRRQH